MQHTSKGIASLGRNGDDTLLHVKKEELAGLEALLGLVKGQIWVDTSVGNVLKIVP